MFERIEELLKKIYELDRQRDEELLRICICIDKMVKRGSLADCFVLGSHVWQMPASETSMIDALGFVYQSAIKTSQGFGTIRWKALEYLQFREDKCLEDQAENNFHPYWNCSPFEKALLLRDYQYLIDTLKERYQW